MTVSFSFGAPSSLAGFAALSLALSLLACSASPGARSNDRTGGGAGSSGAGGGLAGAGGSMAGTGGSSGAAAGGSAGASAGSNAGGSAGVAGGGGSGGVASDPCISATLCDDFEAAAFDSAWSIQMSSTPAPVLDTSKFHGGAQSAKFIGSSQQAFLVALVPGQAFHIRAYVNFEMPTSSVTAHGWFIVGSDNATQGDTSRIRFGASKNWNNTPQVDLNVYSTAEHTQFSNGAGDGCSGCWDNPAQTAFLFSADTWYCVEAFYNGPADEFQVWVDGSELAGLHVTPATMGSGWSPTYQFIKIGAGGNFDTGAVWYDDVVISASAIGCQ